MRYTEAGMGGRLRPLTNASRCYACRVQFPDFKTASAYRISCSNFKK
ncbi:MAG: hypothetical protein LBH59_05795 [Planctomycetaceae bacterium]|nr:hypothetical protein [Planctomycetaceae bacterium]